MKTLEPEFYLTKEDPLYFEPDAIEKERKLMHNFDMNNKMTQMTAQKIATQKLPFPFTNETKNG
jgi:hypothetical protein